MPDPRITGHPIHDELKQILGLAERALLIPDLEADHRARLRRLQEVATHIKSQLAQTRTDLVPMAALNAASSGCQTTRNTLERLIAAPSNVAEIEIANGDIDQALIQIRLLPALPFKVQSAVLVSAADELADRMRANESAVLTSFNQLHAKIDLEKEALDQQLLASKTELEALAQTTGKRLSDIETEANATAASLSADAQTRLEGLRTEIATERINLTALLTQHQASFEAAQEKRLEEANTVLKAAETDLTTKSQAVADAVTAKSEALIADITERQNDLMARSETLQSESEETRRRANELLGFAGAANVATAYLDEAKAQGKAAMFWQGLTLLVFAGLAGAAYYAFVHSPPQPDFTTSEFVSYALIRIPGFLVLAPVVQWIMNQAGHHRERERRAMLRGRELTSFGPFIAQLDPAQQQILIESTAPKYFGGDVLDQTFVDMAKGGGFSVDLVRELAKFLTRRS